jgi:DNA-binding NtrC family response regulator
MRLLLTELGCQVHLAEGSAQAARIAADVALDALLTDLRLRAGDSGLQVLREVQACQPGLRCALITGDTAPERLREARAAGVPLLHKPVSVEALLGVLGQAEAASPSSASAGPA